MLATRLTVNAGRRAGTKLFPIGACTGSASTTTARLVMMSTAAYPPGASADNVNVPVFDAASVQLRSSKAANISYDPLKLRRILSEDESMRNDLAYCLSFAVDDSDFTRNLPQLFADARMREQLSISQDQLRHHKRQQQSLVAAGAAADDAPLPRTVHDALRPSRRAIVITETVAPFRIVDVNGAWEKLCGYTFVESKGKTLGSLLKGPETDQLAATGLISKLLQGEEAGAMLTNYTKDGRKFRNRLRVGPLYDNDDLSTLKYFVGVLQEVHAAS